MSAVVPSPDEFNDLEISSACLVVLKLLISNEDHAARSYGKPGWENGIEPIKERRFHRGGVFSHLSTYNHHDHSKVRVQLDQVWRHAHNEGYLYEDETGDFSLLTDSGLLFANTEIRIQQVSKLAHLNQSIYDKASAKFREGENSDAIGLAFKAVEAKARIKAWPQGGAPNTGWIEEAFKVGDIPQGIPDGPLVNPTFSVGKKHAMQKLFLGAFGVYRNAHLHNDPIVAESETIRILGLASMLMDELE